MPGLPIAIQRSHCGLRVRNLRVRNFQATSRRWRCGSGQYFIWEYVHSAVKPMMLTVTAIRHNPLTHMGSSTCGVITYPVASTFGRIIDLRILADPAIGYMRLL